MLVLLLTYLFCSTKAEIPQLGLTVGLESKYHPIHSLYHSQDINGYYSYGYATPSITSNEIRTPDLVTKGGYSYIDPNGVLQSVQYVADPIHGFRVAATNLPQDNPDVAEAKAKHLALFQETQQNNALATQNAQAAHAAIPQPVQDLPEVAKAKALHLAALNAAYAGIMPQVVQDVPAVVKARAEHLATVEAIRARDEALRKSISLSPVPEHLDGNVVPIHTQHVDSKIDSLEYRPALSGVPSGLYSYGYVGAQGVQGKSNGLSNGYSYIDPKGIVQNVRYIADEQSGFRVAPINVPNDVLENDAHNGQLGNNLDLGAYTHETIY